MELKIAINRALLIYLFFVISIVFFIFCSVFQCISMPCYAVFPCFVDFFMYFVVVVVGVVVVWLLE